MRVMISLSVATGLPWEYFQRQDDEVISTYIVAIRDATGGKDSGRRPEANPPQMSG